MDAQAHEAARWLPALLLLIALHTEIQALATSLGFDGPLEHPFDSQRAGWFCGQEMCNMVERYGTLVPKGAEMGQQQPQVKHPTAVLGARHGPTQGQHNGHTQEESNQPGRQWRCAAEHAPDEQAATETQQGALVQWRRDHF